MITKRLIYEPIERLESAIGELENLALKAKLDGNHAYSGRLLEIVSRDLFEAREKLEYVQELAS